MNTILHTNTDVCELQKKQIKNKSIVSSLEALTRNFRAKSGLMFKKRVVYSALSIFLPTFLRVEVLQQRE